MYSVVYSVVYSVGLLRLNPGVSKCSSSPSVRLVMMNGDVSLVSVDVNVNVCRYYYGIHLSLQLRCKTFTDVYAT